MLRVGVCLLLGYSMAFAETLTMANQWLRGYFAYADKTRMLVYGSLCYGTLLSIALPLYARLSAAELARPRIACSASPPLCHCNPCQYLPTKSWLLKKWSSQTSIWKIGKSNRDTEMPATCFTIVRGRTRFIFDVTAACQRLRSSIDADELSSNSHDAEFASLY